MLAPHGQDGEYSTGEDALRFGLSDATFEAWWRRGPFYPEDTSEYIHLHGGDEMGAKFVCALDFLTRGSQAFYDDTIVRAYLIISNEPESMLRDALMRSRATALFEEEPVAFLLDRLRYRSTRAVERRLEARLVKMTDTLFDDFEASDGLESKERLSAARIAGDLTGKYLSNKAKERATDEARRTRRAVENAIKVSATKQSAPSALPTVDEFKAMLMAMREAIGPDAFETAVRAALPAPPEVVVE